MLCHLSQGDELPPWLLPFIRAPQFSNHSRKMKWKIERNFQDWMRLGVFCFSIHEYNDDDQDDCKEAEILTASEVRTNSPTSAELWHICLSSLTDPTIT